MFNLCFSVLLGQIGTNFSDTLVQNINTFSQKYSQEKVYLHFDNTSYFLGEKIWYKANVVNADQHCPSPLSAVLYVDLITQEGYLLKRNRHYVVNGQCNGNFSLPDSLSAGYYEIRAYTAWMLNFGRIPNTFLQKRMKCEIVLRSHEWAEKFFCENPSIFSRVLPVYNMRADGNFQIKQMRSRPKLNFGKQRETKAQINISFYPEGGHLIENKDCRIAYEIKDEKGKAFNTEILIKTQSGTVIDTLYTCHNGRGIIEITPRIWKEDIKKCRLICVYKLKEYEFKLPESEKTGVALQINREGTMIRSSISPLNMKVPLYITLQKNGKLLTFQPIHSQLESDISLSIDSLEAGVHQLTVFDDTGHIWADRLFFIYPKNEQKINLQASLSDNPLPYQKDSCSFCLTDHKGAAISDATFSVSICDGDINDNYYSTGNIETNLLLSSELRGFIQDPEYYFLPNNSRCVQDMDILMMVQGWRRYDWQVMAGVKPFKIYYQPEKKLEIKGTVYPYNKTIKIRNEVFIRCQIHYPNFIYDAVQQTKNGNFNFEILQLYGNYPMFIHTYKKEKQIKENFDSDDLENETYYKSNFIYKERALPPLPKQLSYYETNEKNIELTIDTLWQQLTNEVIIKEKRKEGLDFSKPNFSYDIIEVLDFLNDIGYHTSDLTSQFDIANYIVNGIALESPIFTGYYCINSEPLTDEQRVVGYELSDLEMMKLKSETRFSKLVSIDYYSDNTSRERFYKGLSIPGENYTYMNFNYRKTFIPLIVADRCIFHGYTPKVQFYCSDYSKEPPETPDHRRTLYWNPNITTDSIGKAKIEFFNNASCRKYRLSAEGITQDGKPFFIHKPK